MGVLLAGVFFCALAVLCHSEPATVTLSSPDLETMNAIIAVIDMDALTTRDPMLSAAEVYARVFIPLPPHLAGALLQTSKLYAQRQLPLARLLESTTENSGPR